MALHDTPVRDFMMALGDSLPKPSAIVIASAHFETNGLAIVADPSPEMIYDFNGFEPELRKTVYAAPGHRELALEIASMLADADITAQLLENRGYDHGTWVPLSLAYPDADVPIVQVSIDPNAGPDHHFQLGRALSDLREDNVLFIGSGNITHNLRALFAKGRDDELDRNIREWVDRFLSWLDPRLEEGVVEDLLFYRDRAPHAEANHPTDEHFLPLYFAFGAAGEGAKGKKLHQSYNFDFLAMDAWSFC